MFSDSKANRALRLLYVSLPVLAAALLIYAQSARADLLKNKFLGSKDRFYSQAGREHEVKFTAVFKSTMTSLSEVAELSETQKTALVRREILPLMDYLFGPLVHRSQGSPQRVKNVLVDWTNARMSNGVVELPYEYRGLWIVSHQVSQAGSLELPVPLNRKVVYSKLWKKCTDSAPDHQTESFYWYFWDPTRYACDQKEGVEYNSVSVKIGRETRLTEKSYPEYNRMLEDDLMSMTMAFGYVDDPSEFNPEKDNDAGVYEYRSFVKHFRSKYASQLKESLIYQKEYKGSSNPELVIGHRFAGTLNGKKVLVNIVVAAGIDQMELFAKSFAHDHEDLFAWYGHSRVGSGFDAERFGRMLTSDPGYYSVTDAYQVIYWAGCNSYSYYTLPFFEFKGGTRNLDIIANGLPSYFSLNSDNAVIATDYFLNWPARPSYQEIVNTIEERASQRGTVVLVAVLGDEDNQ